MGAVSDCRGGMPFRSNASRNGPFGLCQAELLRKFPRGLGQFPLSFLAKSRWAPRSSGEFRSGHATPPESPQLIKNKTVTDRLKVCHR